MRTIDAEELYEITETDAAWVLLDARPPRSYENGHIPGAHSASIADSDFMSRVEAATGSREDTVIVYCADERCDLARRAGERLEREGYSSVLALEGGLEAWKRSGHDLASAART